MGSFKNNIVDFVSRKKKINAPEELGLTAKEFQLFREDELAITQALINKLAEVTGVSEQFWHNRWYKK